MKLDPKAARVSVIQAGPAELETLLPLFEAYREFYGQPPAPEAARRFLLENLSSRRSVIYLANRPGETEPAGFVQLYPSLSSISMLPLWTLNDLYVRPECRGIGAARALLAAAEQLARETGAKGLQLSTGVDNHRAQRLYASAGYVRDEQFHHYDRTLAYTGED